MSNASVVMEAREAMAEYGAEVMVEEEGQSADDGDGVPSQNSSMGWAAAEDLREGNSQNNHLLEDQHNSDGRYSRPTEAQGRWPPDLIPVGAAFSPFVGQGRVDLIPPPNGTLLSRLTGDCLE